MGLPATGCVASHSLPPMKILIAAVLAMASVAAFAHGGGTDSNGCHTDRKTGAYHCH